MIRAALFRHSFVRVGLVLSIILPAMLAIGAPGVSHAQDTAAPFLTITGVDASQLPQIRVTAYGENLGQPLADLPTTLTEDNAEQPVLESKPVDVGIQAAVLFDLSSNVLPRYNELAEAVERFRVANLAAETDWLAAFSVNPENGNLQVLSDWVQDHQGMANEVRLKAPTTAAAATPLFGTISDALDRFSSAAVPDNLRRTLIVFSDGADVVSAQQLETIVRKAARLGVSIDTVMIGSGQNNANRRNLEQIALETGGNYWDYSNVGLIANMENMWQRLGEQRQQQQYTYRLTKSAPREVGLAVTVPDGRSLAAQKDFPAINVRPAQIDVLKPPANLDIPRVAPAPDTALEAIQPTLLPIQLNITWPDGHQRNFQRIEYEIANRVELQTAAPFGEINFPIEDLDSGRYVLRVTAIDELGVESRSAPVSFAVRVERPTPEPTPTDTPEPTATSTPIPVTDTPVADQPMADQSVTDETTPSPGNTTVVTLTNPAAGITMLPGGFLGYGQKPDGGPAVVVAGRTIDVTPITVGLALAPFILVAAAVVLLTRRKKPEEDVFLAATEPAYDSTAFDSKPTMVEQTAYELTEDATEPQVMVNFVSPASLVYVEGGDHLPPKLDIEGGREVRIGRKQAYCDVIVDDQRVSRLHASIVEKEDGKFYIKDEGSSGGTYVNRRKLRVNDMVELHHNDTINFNTVAYRFELNDQSAQAGKP